MDNRKDLISYRVGGCVRDKLLGLNPNDIDYVVIGETPESMCERGFQQVGAGFPVFLHPQTHEEYALARSERSTGDSHTDFEWSWDGISLEEDLKRRDLTINAMAMDEEGNLYDPYGGLQDLNQGLLRHVSDSFQEDPLRVLRVARFAAQLGFSLADETREVMSSMVAKGMLDALTPERVWTETCKALLTEKPSVYFEVLDQVDALAVIFPELKALDGIPQRPEYHAEGDVWIHTRMVMDEAAKATCSLEKNRRLRVLWASVCHDLGKANTPKELLWADDGSLIGRHHGHEAPERFEKALNNIAERIKMPTAIRRFCHVVAEQHQRIHAVRKLSGRKVINLYEALGLNRMLRHDAEYLDDIVLACTADNAGRRHMGKNGELIQPESYPQGDYLLRSMRVVHSVDQGKIMKEVEEKGLSLSTFKQLVHQERMREIKAFLKEEGVDLSPTQR